MVIQKETIEIGAGAPFVVFSMPLSNELWLAHWLECPCDSMLKCSSINEFVERIGASAGVVEVGAAMAWRLIRLALPPARFAVIRRPIAEVKGAYLQYGVMVRDEELALRAAMIEVIAAAPGTFTFDFKDLAVAPRMKKLWEFCRVDEAWNDEWWIDCIQTNVPFNLHQRLNDINANAGGLMAMRSEIANAPTALASTASLGLN